MSPALDTVSIDPVYGYYAAELSYGSGKEKENKGTYSTFAVDKAGSTRS
jgi:hypothetical protein